MGSLQKFKLFAAQCGLETATTSGNPTLSPTQSPVFHLRRRKTLRMLLNRTSDDRRSDLRHILDESPESDRNCTKNKENRGRRKLKELFVSSPSPPFEDRMKRGGGDELDERRDMLPVTGSSGSGGGKFVARRIGSSGSLRPFRKRILTKPWRPVLVSVPEQ